MMAAKVRFTYEKRVFCKGVIAYVLHKLFPFKPLFMSRK